MIKFISNYGWGLDVTPIYNLARGRKITFEINLDLKFKKQKLKTFD